MIATRYTASHSCRMFQYAFARILAERFRYQLRAEPLAYFPRTQEHVPGEVVYNPVSRWFGHWPIGESLKAIDAEELISPPVARLSLEGSFQRFELFAAERERIRENWFRIPGTVSSRPASDLLIVLLPPESPDEGALPTVYNESQAAERSRNEAALLADSYLKAEELRRLVQNVGHEALYLLVDGELDSEALRCFSGLGATVVLSQGIHDLFFIASFQKVAFSQNALAWWAAFLGFGREIYFPPCSRGYWGHSAIPMLAHEPGHHGIDLRVGEERYIYDWWK